MFYQAHKFNNDISDWDVSSINIMLHMCNQVYIFDNNISSWDV